MRELRRLWWRPVSTTPACSWRVWVSWLSWISWWVWWWRNRWYWRCRSRKECCISRCSRRWTHRPRNSRIYFKYYNIIYFGTTCSNRTPGSSRNRTPTLLLSVQKWNRQRKSDSSLSKPSRMILVNHHIPLTILKYFLLLIS